MNTKTLSTRALSVIDQYIHFQAGSATCSIPYVNNKTANIKVGLRAYKGKGSPKEISDEIQAFSVKNHIDRSTLADESLKKLLVDNALGVDCSAFAYYVLNAESEEQKKGRIDKHLTFVNCGGLIGRITCSLRPVENCDVATLAHDKNSRILALNEIAPGDMITMTGGAEGADRNHILVIHQVEYQNFLPTHIHYSHAVAYPEDGILGTGIKQGTIDILSPNQTLFQCTWTENGKMNEQNRIFLRGQKSATEIRRLKWM